MKKIAILVYNDFTFDNRVYKVCKSLGRKYDCALFASKTQQGIPFFEKNRFYFLIRFPLFSALYNKKVNTNYVISNSSSSLKILTNIKKVVQKNRLRKSLVYMINYLGYCIDALAGLLIYHPDIIYANDLNTLPSAYLFAKMFKKKVIFDSHEIWLNGSGYKNSPWIMKKFWIWFEKRVVNGLDIIITTTKTRAEYLSDKYSVSKVHVIKNCPEIWIDDFSYNQFRKEYPIPEDKKIFLYQGLIAKRRGVYTLVSLMQKVDDCYLIIMGLGDDFYNIQEYIKKNHLEQKVFVKYAVKPTELMKYTSSADVGFQLLKNVDFNHYSTISNKFFEYIMAGVPVIASNFPEIKKIVDEYDIGYYVNPEDEEQILSAMQLLTKNPNNYMKKVNNTIIAKKVFNWQNEEKNLYKIVNDLIKENECHKVK